MAKHIIQPNELEVVHHGHGVATIALTTSGNYIDDITFNTSDATPSLLKGFLDKNNILFDPTSVEFQAVIRDTRVP